ncbi:MAG: hypothetical protein ABSA50_01925 [Candidatus Bathyarchaeia archaeon]
MAYASRQSSYLVGTIGVFLQVLGLWGRYSNTQVGTNEASWNIAHLTLYAGFAISVLVIWRGLRVPSMQPATTVPIRFVNVAGLKLAGAGSVLEIVALVGYEIIHRLSSSESYIALALSLLAVGLLTATLGMVIGLTIEYGLIRREIIAASTLKRWLTLISIILMFTSIWLTAAGFFFYLATAFRTTLVNLLAATFLALIAPLVLVPAKRVLPKFGAAISIGVVFNVVVYFFVVVVAQAPVYVPWGLLSLALFDVLILGLKRVMSMTRAGLVSSVVIGVLFWVTYLPFTLYLFSWSSSPQPPLVAVVLGSLTGAMLGNSTYAGLTSVVLGDVTG